MAASSARLLVTAKHLLRMEDHRRREINEGVPPHLWLNPSELVDHTADPADSLIASFLINREFFAEHPDLPESIADRAIRKAKNGSASC